MYVEYFSKSLDFNEFLVYLVGNSCKVLGGNNLILCLSRYFWRFWGLKSVRIRRKFIIYYYLCFKKYSILNGGRGVLGFVVNEYRVWIV